jgi:NADP-dependent 3-hydroxy acid dehydrogenase YdfG
MGRALVRKLAKISNKRVIAVAKEVEDVEGVDFYEADLTKAEDRAEFSNWMHESKYGIETLFHNYPRILKTAGEKRSLEHFKSIMAEIIEQPLLVNADMLDGLVQPRSTILHSVLKQRGLYNVVLGAFVHMERCIEDRMVETNTEVFKVNPGIYSDEHIDNLQLNEEEKEEVKKHKLDPELVADILAEMINDHEEKIFNHINVYKEIEQNEKYRSLFNGNRPSEPVWYQLMK